MYTYISWERVCAKEELHECAAKSGVVAPSREKMYPATVARIEYILADASRILIAKDRKYSLFMKNKTESFYFSSTDVVSCITSCTPQNLHSSPNKMTFLGVHSRWPWWSGRGRLRWTGTDPWTWVQKQLKQLVL